ncbi:hypothetical protein SDC9_155597 [bioreactor metagenome]|uniref:Uncharacterized protein n=1 Tax=bioreactor metagenome TaxID=1076179 RepID=A0A645F1Y3_9ZZZZ
MVSGGGQRVRQAGEHSSSIVLHHRCLAVQQFGRASDHGALGHPDRLQPEADTEDRHCAAPVPHDVDTDPGLLGCAGAR